MMKEDPDKTWKRFR